MQRILNIRQDAEIFGCEMEWIYQNIETMTLSKVQFFGKFIQTKPRTYTRLAYDLIQRDWIPVEHGSWEVRRSARNRICTQFNPEGGEVYYIGDDKPTQRFEYIKMDEREFNTPV